MPHTLPRTLPRTLPCALASASVLEGTYLGRLISCSLPCAFPPKRSPNHVLTAMRAPTQTFSQSCAYCHAHTHSDALTLMCSLPCSFPFKRSPTYVLTAMHLAQKSGPAWFRRGQRVLSLLQSSRLCFLVLLCLIVTPIHRQLGQELVHGNGRPARVLHASQV